MGSAAHLVEQLCIGVGALAWVLLAAVELLGPPTMAVHGTTAIALLLLPALALSYALGIVTDRLADLALDGALSRSLRQRYFASDETYFNAYTAVASASPALLPLLQRTRSVMRVCRGWALNAALLLLVFNAVAWSRPLASALPPERYLTIHGGISVAIGLFWFAHRRLLRSELERLVHRSRAVAAAGPSLGRLRQ